MTGVQTCALPISFLRYSPTFYHFLVLTQIRPFFGNPRDSFSILARIIHFLVLAGTDCTFSGTRRNIFSILVGILPLPGNRPDSTLFRYSHRFHHFPVLARTVFRYSNGFYIFAVLTQIRPFFGDRRDSFSILARIIHFLVLAGTFFRYS